MPVQELAINSSNWEADKLVEPLNDRVLPGVYNLNIYQTESYQFNKTIRKVAVIGAGPAGLPTAKLLLDEGLKVKIIERNHAAGGTWIYHEEKPINPEFPSEIPTKIVRPSLPPNGTSLPYSKEDTLNDSSKNELLNLNPPTPCYRSLKNNVPTPLLQYKDLEWRKDTPWFTTHEKILEYLQDYSREFKLDDITEFNTSLEHLEELPDQEGWKVLTKHADLNSEKIKFTWKEEIFDAVVIATGHYHAPYVPDLPGLSSWRNKWPEQVIHSKQYRVPEEFTDKTVLLIGNGTSALDISRDIGPYAKKIYQSVRENKHQYDEKYLHLVKELSQTVPKNVQRVVGIQEFKSDIDNLAITEAVIELVNGEELTGIDVVIVCTGYVFNFHFLEQLHRDSNVNHPEVDDDHILVKDGTQVFNLHKDIFYIPNPTLSFVGIPFHIATFSLFEYQSYAVARVYSKSAQLPTEKGMRQEWAERSRQKGKGREFHALGNELEAAYIKDIVNWVNRDGHLLKKKVIKEHSEEWYHTRSNSLTALVEELKKNI